MKNSIVASLGLFLSVVTLWQCPSTLAAEIDMAPLRMDRVQLNLLALVKTLDKQERDNTFADARKAVPALSAGYFESLSGFNMWIWAFSDRVEAAREVLERIARQPFEKWDITLQVHWGKRVDKTGEDDDSEKQGDGAATRQERLERQVKWRDEATIGNALQTLGDELRIGVVVEPAVLATRDNDWRVFLSEPLKVGEVGTTDDLTVEGLIELVADQLNATSKMEKDFLYFR